MIYSAAERRENPLRNMTGIHVPVYMKKIREYKQNPATIPLIITV